MPACQGLPGGNRGDRPAGETTNTTTTVVAPLPVGEPCTQATACASALCVHGVCCDTACSGTCDSCSVGVDGPGHCSAVPQGEDPHKQCGAACLGCFEGACAPALLGTNPGEQCTVGQVCGVAGTCGAAFGGACTAGDGCALGTCASGQCVGEVASLQVVPAFSADAQEREVLGTGVTPSGGAVVLLQETTYSDSNSISGQNLVLAGVAAGDAWTVLVGHSTGAALLMDGAQSVVVGGAAWDAPSCGDAAGVAGASGCDLVAAWYGPHGERGRRERIWVPSSGSVTRHVCSVLAAKGNAGNLLVAVLTSEDSCYATTSRAVHTFQRDSTGWHREGADPVLTGTSGLLAVGLVGSEVTVLDYPSADADSVRATHGVTSETWSGGMNCSPSFDALSEAGVMYLGGTCYASDAALLLKYAASPMPGFTALTANATVQGGVVPVGLAGDVLKVLRITRDGLRLEYVGPSGGALGELVYASGNDGFVVRLPATAGGTTAISLVEYAQVTFGGTMPETRSLAHKPLVITLAH